MNDDLEDFNFDNYEKKEKIKFKYPINFGLNNLIIIIFNIYIQYI